MVNRKDDLIDIWDKATTGWIAPPTQPGFGIEGRDTTLTALLKRVPTNGYILVRKDQKFERERLSATYENRVRTFNCTILMVDDDGLELIFDQAREVFDRYNDVPWSTSALGTSTTYSFVLIDEGQQDIRLPKNAMDITCQLNEMTKRIKIA